MLTIGLTGGIASGKSTVSQYLCELGAKIIDADKMARELVQPGGQALQEIIEVFGADIIDAAGHLDRKKMGRLIFQEPKAREKLNNILHPIIIKETKKFLKEYSKKRDVKAVVVDAPLLIEAGMHKLVDEVWVVAVSEEIQLKRLAERDGLSEKEGRMRLASQMSLQDKLKFADRVIDNSGTIEETREQVRLIWQDY